MPAPGQQAPMAAPYFDAVPSTSAWADGDVPWSMTRGYAVPLTQGLTDGAFLPSELPPNLCWHRFPNTSRYAVQEAFGGSRVDIGRRVDLNTFVLEVPLEMVSGSSVRAVVTRNLGLSLLLRAGRVEPGQSVLAYRGGRAVPVPAVRQLGRLQ